MEKAACFKDAKEAKVERITSIASRRGFFFQTADIYGGRSGFFTYGHLGKSIKNKFEELWRKYFLEENFYEIQSNNILPEDVFKASGHIEHFNDPLTECKKCHFRFRADQFLEDKSIWKEGLSVKEMTRVIKNNKLKCPKCSGALSEVKWFNMMFPLTIGRDEKGYLSPETAQAAYLAFKQEFEATRKKIPLGIAIIDKAYRNEISPRQLFFRLREFTQAELQIFINAENMKFHEDFKKVENYKIIVKREKSKKTEEKSLKKLKDIPKFYLYYLAKVQKFYLDILKIPRKKFRFKEIGKNERAFYNKIHFDVEIDLETFKGFKEISGIHYRTDYDLKGHQKQSKKNLEIFYNDKRFIPHVLELSFGIDRNIWMILDAFYKCEKVRGEIREIFQFPPKIAPIDVAIFPLVNKDNLPKIAKRVFEKLKNESNLQIFYDDSGSIGRRYRRQDEIGTPFCITIDYQSKKDNTVTIRDRDSMKQKRVKISNLSKALSK